MTKDKRKYMGHTQAAQHRATISAMLSNEPERKFNTAEVAAKIGQNNRTAGQILSGMARGGLIAEPIIHNNKKHWAWPTDKAAPTPEKKSTPLQKVVTRTPADEVELCIGGITVVVGRNEKTGRIRITLET